MRLHNFLVDYRNEIVAVTGQYLNSHLAAHLQNISEYDEIAGVFHNDNCRPVGRVSNNERIIQSNGIARRDKVRNNIDNHHMRMPKKLEI